MLRWLLAAALFAPPSVWAEPVEPMDAGALAEEPGSPDEVLDDGEEEEEASLADSEGVPDGGFLYTADLSEAELERRFVEALESLGSISVGFAEAGRLINGARLESGEAWRVTAPQYAWGTAETIDHLITAARSVREKLPQAPPLRVGHIGKREGGYLRPHQSHQSGRDVDLGFYYPKGVDPARPRGNREQLMDLPANWELVRALVTLTDVQVILVDRRVQERLYQYALSRGENREWLDRLFRSGPASLLRHARRHRDHFHVRFFAGRPQELGRRVQPLLAKRPEQNLVIHRVRKGDTLGRLAAHYGSTVRLIEQANRLGGTSLKVGRTLHVPMRGPCNRCPLAPPVVVPPRVLPPPPAEASTGPSLEALAGSPG